MVRNTFLVDPLIHVSALSPQFLQSLGPPYLEFLEVEQTTLRYTTGSEGI